MLVLIGEHSTILSGISGLERNVVSILITVVTWLLDCGKGEFTIGVTDDLWGKLTVTVEFEDGKEVAVKP